jgi:nucleotide-binding universal stress UspA family protein
MQKTRIVVGVDGSAGSLAALAWAATEARLRETELRVVAAYHRRLPGRAQPTEGQEAAAVVHDAVAQARAAAPGVLVRGLALPGYAAPVLLHADEEAALLVVGCRADAGMPGMPHGSVSGQVATQAKGSVVVVRGRATTSGPVVAAVGDGPSATAVLGHAFEEAALRRAAVRAVTVREGGGTTAGTDLDRWREKYPDIEVDHEVLTGRPDRVLAERCRKAQLVVAGPRRHGFEGVLLGSVGTRLLREADCPVLVAR